MSVPEESLEESLFQAALEKESPGERAAFLDEACRGNQPLRQRLEVLMEGCFQAGGFLSDQPALIPVNEKPGDRIGRYKLREQIGEGGCGVVYVAEQEKPVRRKVALKVIKLGMDTRNVVARFEAERQALAMMDHPNIAKVFDAGATETGRPYFVMELVRGIKITDYCDQNQLSTPDRLELFIKVCQAVQHAHQKGIIHRDLKPSNILVTINDGAAVPKVIDFGIAKATEGRLTDLTVYTDLHQFIGTPAYMSPEQATMTSLDIDTRSDIYSLGVLLYELLTGRTPFDTKELMALGVDALRQTLREREPARPSTRLSTMLAGELTTTARNRASEPPRLIHLLRGDLDWIVMKCLEKDRTRRYETANGLAADIKNHLANEPVVARPPSAAYKFQKAFRRNKLLFGAGVIVALALVLGVAGIIWQWRRAEISRQELAREAYWAQMTLANHAANAGEWGGVAKTLDRTRPRPGQPDLRGWEWRYLWWVSRSEVIAEFGHRPNTIVSLALLPDKHTVVLGEEEGGFSLWDLDTKSMVYELPGHINNFTDPNFPAGQVLATRVAVIPGTSLLAYTECLNLTNSRVQIWDVSTRALARSLPLPYEPRHLAVSPDGRLLAASTMNPDKRVFLFEVGTGKLVRTLTAWKWNFSGGHSMVFSPDGRWLTLDDGIGGFKIVSSETGEDRYRLQVGQTYLLSAAFSPDGRWLATGGAFEHGGIRLWDMTDGHLAEELQGSTTSAYALSFDSTGRELFAGRVIWDMATRRVKRTLTGNDRAIRALALTADNHTLLTAADGDVFEWDVDQPQITREGNGLGMAVRSCDFIPNGGGLLLVGTNGTLNRARPPGFPIEPLAGAGGDCTAVLVLPKLAAYAVGHRDGRVNLFDLGNQVELRHWDTAAGAVNQLMNPAGTARLGVICADGRLQVWRADSGEKQWETQIGGWSERDGFSAHDGILYRLNGDRGLTGYDLVHGRIIERPYEDRLANSIDFSPDGTLAVTTSSRGPKKLLDARTFKTIADLDQIGIVGHRGAFWPDNSRVAISGVGVTVADLVNGRELLTVTADFRTGWDVAVSPDGDTLVQGADGKPRICVWWAPSWEEIGRREAERRRGSSP